MKNKIIKGNCLDVMSHIDIETVDVILTSPFYNTNKKSGKNINLNNTNIRKGNYHHVRYDNFVDNMTNVDYNKFTINVFDKYNLVLKDDGVILYNMSYGSENTNGMFEAIYNIISKTNFEIVDVIVWKKSTALPNNMSSNKLTRITEFVFVFCKKGMSKKFKSNKKVVSTRSTGQSNYENIYNFIEAKNNDGSCKLNKATYSTELCDKLLVMYAQPNSLILDSFNGTGTTGVSAIKNGHSYIGIELSEEQCEYSVERIKKETGIELELINKS